MNIRTLLATLTLVVAAPMTFAADRGPTALDDAMEEMNMAYRRLTRQIGNPARNANSLEQVALLRKHSVEATKLDPQKTADLPEAERAKFVAAYQAGMKEFVEQVDKLKVALEANKNDEARDILQAMKKSQEDGHNEFRRKKK